MRSLPHFACDALFYFIGRIRTAITSVLRHATFYFASFQQSVIISRAELISLCLLFRHAYCFWQPGKIGLYWCYRRYISWRHYAHIMPEMLRLVTWVDYELPCFLLMWMDTNITYCFIHGRASRFRHWQLSFVGTMVGDIHTDKEK